MTAGGLEPAAFPFMALKRTTFPLPRADADRLVAAMVRHRYSAQSRPEGNGWTVVFVPPVGNRERKAPTVDQLVLPV